MKKAVTLKENHVFRRLYAKGKSAVSPYLAIYVRRNGGKGSRLGVTVSTKLGCAVVRNRARRRLREVFRLNAGCLKQGYDIILVARYRTAKMPWKELNAGFFKCAKKLDLLEEEAK